MRNVTFRIERNDTLDEWRVACFVNGKFNEDRTYYTDDREDAIETMVAMQEEQKRNEEHARVN